MNTIHLAPGEIDAALRTHRLPGTRFVLEPGIYTTRGGFGFSELDLCMLAPNCEIIGAGAALTKIRLVDPVVTHNNSPTQYVEVLTGGARTKGGSEHLAMSGFTLDLTGTTVPTVGVHLWTSRAVIRDVRVVGVMGSRTHPGSVKEGFGILVNSANTGDFDGGHKVEDCAVHLAPTEGENYTTALFVGCPRGSRPLLRSTVLRSVCVAKGGHAAFAANDHTDIIDCQAHGFIRCFFCDTGPIREITLRRMFADDVQWAMDVRVGSPGDERRGIVVEDSTFVFWAPDGQWVQAVLAADEAVPAGTPLDDIEFIRCRFVARDGVRPASKGRTRGQRVGAIAVTDSRWVGPWQSPVVQDGAKAW